MDKKEIIKILTANGLKVTPQRIEVLEAVAELRNHPNVENIIEYIKQNNPSISTGTIYKTLDTYVKKGLIKKVTTDSDIMRYDSVSQKHHHLYCSASDRIEDFYDDDLNSIIETYLKKKHIPNFSIKDFKLQIIGNFSENKKIK